MFSGVVDESVRFGQKKLLALRIQLRGARERERASICTNAFSKDGLSLLTVPGRVPLANVENQDARIYGFGQVVSGHTLKHLCAGAAAFFISRHAATRSRTNSSDGTPARSA